MRLARALALASLGITAAAVLLFLFSPSPELSFVIAAGVSFVLLLLLSLPVLEVPEEEFVGEVAEEVREKAKAEEKEGIIPRLREALEEGVEEKERVEGPGPELPSDLVPSPPGWKLVGEGRADEETVLGGGERQATGLFRIWEKEGRRLALYALFFPSSELAEARLGETINKLGKLLQERLPQQGHFYLEREGIDGMIWRREATILLLLLGKGEKGEVRGFLQFLPENLRPPGP